MKIVLNDVVSGANVSVINDNFTKIEEALNSKVLYRDNPPQETNAMVSALDMNSQRIYNLAAPVSSNDPVRLIDLKNAALAGGGGAIVLPLDAGEVTYTPTRADTITQDLDKLLAESVSLSEYGVDNTGVTAVDTKFQKAIDSGVGVIHVGPGTYLFNSGVTLKSNVIIICDRKAIFKAGVNSLVFFKTLTHTYFTQVWWPQFDANSKTNVIGFDLIGFRNSTGIYYPIFGTGMERGVYYRQLCWDTELIAPFGQGVKYPIEATDGSNAILIQRPAFDGLSSLGYGITISNGGTYVTTSVKIEGGYIQGYAYGVVDSGYGTMINGTYFELCTSADILFNNAIKPSAFRTQHYADVGPKAIMARGTDGAFVLDPLMTSGSRSTGLFDFDTSNFNCYALITNTVSGINLPLGVTSGIGFIPKEDSGTFTPTVIGSTTAGAAGLYQKQVGKWKRIGSQVFINISIEYTGHSGAGNLVITTIPGYLAPSSYDPVAIGTCNLEGIPFTGPHLFSYLNGTGAQVSFGQTTAAGVTSLVPISVNGKIRHAMTYSL